MFAIFIIFQLNVALENDRVCSSNVANIECPIIHYKSSWITWCSYMDHYSQSWRRLRWISLAVSVACIEFWVHRVVFVRVAYIINYFREFSNYFCFFFFIICIHWSTHRDWFFNSNNSLLALRNEYSIRVLFGFIQWKIFFSGFSGY